MATETAVTIPQSVQDAGKEAYELLKRRGFVLPCPFEKRLTKPERLKNLTELAIALGYRYANASFESYEVYNRTQKACVERLLRFAESMPDALQSGGGLLLFGNPGTGKDHLLAALLRVAVVLHGLSVRWIDGGDLFDKIHLALCSDGDYEWRKLSESFHAPHVLAISDPQPPQDSLSPQQVRRLRDIIDKRYRAGKSTWLTTNIDQRDYAERLFTKPVMERMREQASVVLCDWPSYRERRNASF